MFIIVPKNDLDWYSTQKIFSQSFTEISRSADLTALRTAWKRESIEPELGWKVANFWWDSVLITVVPRWTFLAIMGTGSKCRIFFFQLCTPLNLKNSPRKPWFSTGWASNLTATSLPWGIALIHDPKIYDIDIPHCKLSSELVWLVVLTILKNMNSSMGRILPYIMENKKCLKPPNSCGFDLKTTCFLTFPFNANYYVQRW